MLLGFYAEWLHFSMSISPVLVLETREPQGGHVDRRGEVHGWGLLGAGYWRHKPGALVLCL